MKKNIVIRVLHGNKIGLGHLTRTIALTESIIDDYKIDFLLSEELIDETIFGNLNVSKRVVPFHKDEIKNGSLKDFISQCDLFIIDGYLFDEKYQMDLFEKGIKTLLIDDQCKGKYFVNAILNHLPGVSSKDYIIGSDKIKPKFYLGPEYALLRKIFLVHDKVIKTADEINTILFTFGGGECKDVAEILIPKIDHYYKNANKILLLGSLAEDRDGFYHLISSVKNLTIINSLSQSELINLINTVDFVFCSPGMICYECFSIGVPVGLGYFNEHQKRNYEFIIKSNLAFPIHDFRSNDIHIYIKDLDSVDVRTKYVNEQKKVFGDNIKSNIKNMIKELVYDSVK